jgi:hypothetical protein
MESEAKSGQQLILRYYLRLFQTLASEYAKLEKLLL